VNTEEPNIILSRGENIRTEYKQAGDKVMNPPVNFPLYHFEVEDLLSNKYKSTPRNKLIADFCRSLGRIVEYGSGIRRIVDYFKAENLPVPVFQNISDGFMVSVSGTEIKDVGKELTGSTFWSFYQHEVK